MSYSKYHAKKTVVDGHTFHSKKEASRYTELKFLQKAGSIKGLELQPKFDFVHNGIKICRYIADFRYIDVDLDQVIIEDVKGVLTQLYKIKKKLLRAFYGFEIKET